MLTFYSSGVSELTGKCFSHVCCAVAFVFLSMLCDLETSVFAYLWRIEDFASVWAVESAGRESVSAVVFKFLLLKLLKSSEGFDRAGSSPFSSTLFPFSSPPATEKNYYPFPFSTTSLKEKVRTARGCLAVPS